MESQAASTSAPVALDKGFRIGGFEVRPAECVLVSNREPTHIEPKVMQVLMALAESAPRLVSREELTARVWPRGFVTDDALNRCISSLRNVLGDNARAPKYILTVPRKGYRLA